MPEPVKLLSVPPITVTSPTLKSVLVSDRLKLMVAVSPRARLFLLALTITVGGTVSVGAGGVTLPPPMVGVPMLSDTVLLVSAPSALKLPAASENAPLATTMAALLALLLGVKVAL